MNGLCACDTVLVPIQCEFFALEGLSELMSTVRTVKNMYNRYLEIEGVLLTMYDGRLNLTLQVVAEVKKYFPNKVYKTVVPRNVRLSEAPSFGAPVNYYDPASKGRGGLPRPGGGAAGQTTGRPAYNQKTAVKKSGRAV